MAKERKKLGEILYKAGILQKEPLIAAIKIAQKDGKKLGQVLLEKKLIDQQTLTKAIAKQRGLRYVNLDKHPADPEARRSIPEDLIKRHKILPLGRDNGRLKIAISDPDNIELMDNLRFRLNTELEFYLASEAQIQGYLEEAVEEIEAEDERDEIQTSIDATAEELRLAGEELQAEVLRAQAGGEQDEGGVVRLVNLIIDTAYRMRASDIHVEPMADRVRIRYRVDGVCLEKDNVPKNIQASMLTRFKILSGMDIAEKRLPQDGRIKRNIDGQDIDFRVSILPSNHGESLVMRILRPDAVNIGVKSLGFEGEDYERFQKIIKRPNGIFLVTGPTGSGKTTTLYAALQELNKPDKKIITAEDPVEYNFAGMNQCQVKDEIGLTFDIILRSMLRQAPNIILVGEIRDGIVADIAIQAALTGHLVFSTLHTNDALSAITRLIDMGVKPFLVASSIQAIMAQRLIRVICKNCKIVNENPNPKYLDLLNITAKDIEKHPIYKGAGCQACQGTGYKGRVAVFEMVELNNELRELAFSRAPTTELRKTARAAGMRFLSDDGKIKIFNGVTTPEEVAGVAQVE
ncbi:MAG: GspE/PulE family protein [Phycisphaerae bacterium]|nr:GspE/PulE family protein [Phycisphaerae bacterium]